MRHVKRAAALLLILPMLTACPELKALNDAMERDMMNHPGGPFAFGQDLVLTGAAPIQAMMPAKRR